jgi:hypothetical protein
MKTEIAFILDRSGSMETIRQATIEGFNTFLRDQQSAPDQARFTLVFFETETDARHNSIPIAEVTPLDADSYVPGGSTALLDAIGETIDSLGKKFAAMPESDRPGHITVAILTDGEENSSRHYTWHQIADRIKHQTEKYSWEFLFLGAGPDTIATAGRMNIEFSKVAVFEADAAGSSAAMSSFSRKTLASRAKKSGLATAEQLHDADAPLADIVHEEDQKHRK